MSAIATYWAWEQEGLRPVDKLILLYICDGFVPEVGYYTESTPYEAPSVGKLARFANIDITAVQQSLKRLRDLGLLDSGNAPVYRSFQQAKKAPHFYKKRILPDGLRRRILHRDDYRCGYCGKPATTVDHIFPEVDGGSSHPENLTACCKPCNTRKGRQSPHKFGFPFYSTLYRDVPSNPIRHTSRG